MISPATLYTAGKSLKKTKIPSIFLLFSTIPSSPFSSSCKIHQNVHQTPPPVPKKVPYEVSAHGVTWQDPYHWMKQTDDPDFVKYLHQENSYAEAFMDDTKTLQHTFYSEMIARIPSKISTPPKRWGPWFYFEYIPEGKEYPVICRKLATEKNGWIRTVLNYVMGEWWKVQILLDWNEIAEQYGYVHVGTCQVSPDHNYLAFTLDITGAERFMLQVKNLNNGVLENLRVDDVVSLAWAQDGCTLFYTVSDECQRPHRVQYCKMGQDPINNIEMYTETDSSFCVDITSTKDGMFITVNSNSRTSSEVYVIDATNPQRGLHRVHIRIPGVQYFLEHHHGFFYALTNQLPCGNNLLSTGNYYLIRCRVQDVQAAKWETIIVPSEDISIHDMDIFNEHLVLFLNKNGFPIICSVKLPIDESFKKEMKIDDLNPWYFPLPSNLCQILPGSNHDFKSSQYRAVVSFPVIPDVIVDYDMSRHTFSIVHQDVVPGSTTNSNSNSCSITCKRESFKFLNTQSERGEDVINNVGQKWSNFSDAYCCEIKEVVSHDGIRIPLTILYSRAHHKGQSPGLLQGYGAYGQVLDKTWSADRLSLLDRGWVVAFADVRGGGGADPSWHKSGSGLFKSNSIADFVACAEYLISEGYVHKYQLGASGGSAGGLLVGAAANRHPQLFRAIILKILAKELFKVLKERLGSDLYTHLSKRVTPVAGDITHENMGVKNTMMLEEMWREVDIVVNIAATTNFDERYDISLALNTFGAKHVYNFAMKCSKIKLLLHVSTAYVCGEKTGLIMEDPYKMGETLNGERGLDIHQEKQKIEEVLYQLNHQNATNETITLAMKELGIQRARHYGWPNTYVFTKAMGEMLLGEMNQSKQLPLVIIRPTIITSTYKEPFPGWVEGIRTVDSVAVGYGKGKLTCFLGDPDSNIDLIPADMVVNTMLVAMVAHSNEPDCEVIYHVGSSFSNPIKYSEIKDYGQFYFTRTPWINKDGKAVKVGDVTVLSSMPSFRRYMAIRYLLPLKGLQLVNMGLCQLLQEKYVDLSRKVKYVLRMVELYEPYLFFKGVFDDMNTEKLRKAAEESSDAETDVFYFDPKCIDWEDYFVNTHLTGLVKYVLK